LELGQLLDQGFPKAQNRTILGLPERERVLERGLRRFNPSLAMLPNP